MTQHGFKKKILAAFNLLCAKSTYQKNSLFQLKFFVKRSQSSGLFLICTHIERWGNNLTVSYDEEQISLPLGDVVILRDFKKPESLKTVIGALH